MKRDGEFVLFLFITFLFLGLAVTFAWGPQ
jgi:hypothetical protein